MCQNIHIKIRFKKTSKCSQKIFNSKRATILEANTEPIQLIHFIMLFYLFYSINYSIFGYCLKQIRKMVSAVGRLFGSGFNIAITKKSSNKLRMKALVGCNILFQVPKLIKLIVFFTRMKNDMNEVNQRKLHVSVWQSLIWDFNWVIWDLKLL